METNFQGINSPQDYVVDVVFCIDTTKSMGNVGVSQTKLVNVIKQYAVNLYSDFCNIMAMRGKTIRQMRARIITFREYIADGEHAMMVTDFFQLPQQIAEFESCIDSIHAGGGGDDGLADGLEALAYAIRSKWTTEVGRKRQIIIVCTDTDAHELGFGKQTQYYPKGMPKDFGELSDWWNAPSLINQVGKRLLLFAPDINNWKHISDNWDCVWHCPSAIDDGLAEQFYSEILNTFISGV